MSVQRPLPPAGRAVHILNRVCLIAADITGAPVAITGDETYADVFGSLDEIDFWLTLEREFNVVLVPWPYGAEQIEDVSPIHREILTRKPLRIRDVAEVVQRLECNHSVSEPP